MIGTFIAKELRPKSAEKKLEYSIKIQKNLKTKPDIFGSKFNLRSYKIFGVNNLYQKKVIKHMVLEFKMIHKSKQSFSIQNSTWSLTDWLFSTTYSLFSTFLLFTFYK